MRRVIRKLTIWEIAGLCILPLGYQSAFLEWLLAIRLELWATRYDLEYRPWSRGHARVDAQTLTAIVQGVRAYMQQSRVYVGMILILIFGEVLGLYGYVLRKKRGSPRSPANDP